MKPITYLLKQTSIQARHEQLWAEVAKKMAEQLWGIWVTSSCDRDSDDGWLHDSTMRKPWTSNEAHAKAYAAKLATVVHRSRFGHEARPYAEVSPKT